MQHICVYMYVHCLITWADDERKCIRCITLITFSFIYPSICPARLSAPFYIIFFFVLCVCTCMFTVCSRPGWRGTLYDNRAHRENDIWHHSNFQHTLRQFCWEQKEWKYWNCHAHWRFHCSYLCFIWSRLASAVHVYSMMWSSEWFRIRTARHLIAIR